MKKYKDPLKQQGVGAESMGTFSQKLEYDPKYGRNFYTLMYAGIGFISALAAYFTGIRYLYYVSAAFGMFAIFTLLFYTTWKGYDIASSRVYCEKLYPPGTPKSKIRECLFEREREERLRGGGSGSGLNDAFWLGTGAYLLSNNN